MKKLLTTVLVAVLVMAGYGGWRLKQEADRVMSDDPRVWSPVIEELLEKPVPVARPVLFVGSSSIRFWGDDLTADLADVGAFGRGFGGAKIDDIRHYSQQLIGDLNPRAIVVYIGSNDLSGSFGMQAIGNTEAEARYRSMLDELKRYAKGVPIYLVALKPTRRSVDRWAQIQAFNTRLQKLSESDGQLGFIDANSDLWNQRGEVRSDTLLWDGMHLNRTGYQVWGRKIQERLREDGYSRR